MRALSPLRPITAGLLTGLPGVRHGFFTREGGVSEGIYEGLNVGLGSKDDREHVAENRRRVSDHLGFADVPLSTPHQIHSPDAVVIDEPFGPERPKADAVVTKTPGVIVGVLAADCGPVLFADPEAQIVGAAHSGWKGAISGVLEKTVETMECLGATKANIRAVLGPSITQANYEVGPEFRDRFIDEDPANTAFFSVSERAGHFMFDLPGYILKRLDRAGVQAASLDLCTYADEERFFSYRRTTHRGEPDYGRQISAIVLGG